MPNNVSPPPGFTLADTPSSAKPPPGFTLASQPAASPDQIYYNDAGQPFTMSGKPVPQPAAAPQGYTGEILPFSRDPSGHLHLAVPEMIAAPLRGAVEMGARAIGEGEGGKNPLRPLNPDELSTLTSIAGEAGPAAGPAEQAAALAARKGAQIENQARGAISRQFAKGVAGGAPTASDVIEEMTKARAQGQPLTLADVNNTELGSLVGTTYRQGGAARSTIKNFFEGRGKEATARAQGIIDKHLSDQSLKETSENLIKARSEHAKPLWDEARAGGSLAPLEYQFETAFRDMSSAERQAEQQVAAANQALTAGSAKQSVAGNVYSSSAANRAAREAKGGSAQAEAHLQNVRQQKAEALARLRRAQEDRTANAPGAIWSPRLQELLNQPEVQAGIRRGFANERRIAAGKGEPFNPHEYAIVGLDEHGHPIVGAVPNMSLLMVAKEGLDAIIQSSAMRDPLTGRPTKAGLSYIHLRDGLVNELDRLNPLYRAARNQWSGDTASIRALNDGRHFLDKSRFSLEELPAHFAGLTDSDKQFFILGVADELKNRLFGAADSANKGRIINSEATRMRIRPLFNSDAEAHMFIDSIERERQMALTPGRIYGGSATGERVADDKTAEALVHAAHGIGHLLQGRFLSSIAAGLRMKRLFGGKPNPELNEAIARNVTNPNIKLSDRGDLLPQVAVPPKPPTMAKPNATSLAVRALPGAAAGAYDNMTGQMQ